MASCGRLWSITNEFSCDEDASASCESGAEKACSRDILFAGASCGALFCAGGKKSSAPDFFHARTVPVFCGQVLEGDEGDSSSWHRRRFAFRDSLSEGCPWL